LPGAGDDPYWEAFINRPPADIRNTIPEVVRKATEGNVFPTQTELHSPNVTSDHVKELAAYLIKAETRIADLTKQDAALAHDYPYAIVCAVRSEYDPYEHRGIGGQAGVQAGQFVTYIVASWIREMGFRATIKIETTREQRERLAIATGLGTRDRNGRLTTSKHGTKVYIGDIIYTDLPMQADG